MKNIFVCSSRSLSIKISFLMCIAFISSCTNEKIAKTPRYIQNPWESSINEFEKLDNISMPPQKAVLFVGSSMIRLWDGLPNSFPGINIIQRGIGGCELIDLSIYYRRIILKYEPDKIVIYAGENDIAGGVLPDSVINRFKYLHALIRKDLPNADIIYLSLKGSPSRWPFKKRFELANKEISKFISEKTNTYFVDIYTKLLTPDSSKPDIQYYRPDTLHLNHKGYSIIRKSLNPYLYPNR